MKLHARRTLAAALLLSAMACGLPAATGAEWMPDARVNAALPAATRADLYKVLDSYLAALKTRDPQRVKWAPQVRNTENNVALAVGDGLWGTITALGSYDLRFADTLTGEVGYFGTVTETTDTSAFTLRLKVVNGEVAEAETLVVRQADSGIKFEGQTFENKPVMNEMLPAGQRSPRARMIALANGYFDTLQLNDGTLYTKFAPNCERVENGVKTTHNAAFTVTPVAKLGCEEQFRMGYYRYNDRLRGRRFPLVDEERGLVLAGGFIDKTGRLGEFRLTDGTVAKPLLYRPHTFYLLELFKIKDGAIEQIESNFITMPYHMPSPWDDWASGR
ncbi:MAG TPA: hypothetical protein VMH77_07005 [Steroidobacteraceae bacterium]|nr:hypothetical protein [Steroidobacteraceae bacterium]